MKILGVKIDDISLPQAVKRVEGCLESKKQRIFTIVTPNPEIIVQAQDSPQLRKILNEADLAVPDGVGIILASKIGSRFNPPAGEAGVQGSRVKKVVPGVRLMRELCRVAAERGWTVGLYGGRKGVSEKALTELQEKYKGLQGWSREPGKIDISQLDNHVDARLRQEVEWVRKQVEKSRTRLLFVGLGAPKQEYFIEIFNFQFSIFNSKQSLAVMTVGGAFDELSGKVRPAPEMVSRLGCKWLWRLFWQPWRIKRQLRLVRFVYLTLRGL